MAQAKHIKILFCDLPLQNAFFSRMTLVEVKVQVETTEKVFFDKKNSIPSVTLGMKLYCVLEHKCRIRKAKRKSDRETVHFVHKRKNKNFVQTMQHHQYFSPEKQIMRDN